MSIIHEPLRYAHDEGHTDVCFSEDGENMITCGADGDIRIWSINEGEDPHHTCIGEWALSVRQKNDRLYVATGSNEIQILSLPEGERDGVLVRSTDPYNQIATCTNKNIIAMASEGMEVLIMDLETNSVITSFKELGGPCLSVALCPDASKVAVSCGNGKLLVWELKSNELVKEISCFPKVNSFSNARNLCRIDFHPTGKYLAYPERNTIKLLDTESWEEDSLNADNISVDFSILQFSKCGKYLVAASIEGDFVIWLVAQRKVYKITKHESSKAISGLMWNPKGNGEIVYTDVEGQMSVMSNCCQLEHIEADELDQQSTEMDFQVNNDDDGDDENAISVEKLKQQYMGSPEPELKDFSQASSRSQTPRPRSPEVPLQAPFMPSSTPEHLDPRYLCYNGVGVVKSYGNSADDEMASKTIEVEFHDSTFHNSMMLQNYQDYSIGCVDKGALVLANNSQLMVVPLLTSNKEWTLKVEESEEIILVAGSENLVCFATTTYLVRVCSVYGTQRGVISIPGPLVSMSAFKNVLLVAYHMAGVRNKDQCINVKLFKFEGTCVECLDLGSALGPESTMFWLGFSDMGTPGMMDSLGMLYLYPPRCNTWIPFCDTTKHRKGLSDGFFITSVFESYQAVGGIKCKGAVYPGFIPRPTLCEIPLEPPFAEGGTEKTQMEMNLYTWSNLRVMNTDKKFKETALKTFALACKNDLDQRALELVEIIGNAQIVNLGLKYASKLNKRRLVEKLMELAEKLQQDDDAPTPVVKSADKVSIPQEEIVKPPTINRLSLSKLSTRNRKNRKEATQNTPTPEENRTTADQNNENNGSFVNTQESLFNESTSTLTESNTPKNPFLKKLKSNQSNSPLSLSDKSAGLDYEAPTKGHNNVEGGEKRKLSDSDTEKPTEKQPKLDRFMFSKR
ncbi:chromosome transmission fidelity 4 [Rhynchophorus ferrugineus]|uniref:chromosome transmission fidelity 4 n=1 Tax=Rhynchophorus ferrugineus TaxID=354439 RepID=UPI003FCDCFD5